jgi:hypothetical protein
MANSGAPIMRDREKLVLRALKGMTSRFPHFYDEEVVSRLRTDKNLPGGEGMLVAALVEMADHLLDRYDDGVEPLASGSASDPASIDAVAALVSLGFMNVYSAGSRSANRSGTNDESVAYEDVVLVTSGVASDAATLNKLGLTNVRLAEWTETGRRFLAENMEEWKAWEQQIADQAERKQKIAAKFIKCTDRLTYYVAGVVLIVLYELIVNYRFN